MMKYLALLFLLLAITAQGAFTVTARGTVSNNASASTFVCAPTSTIAAGSMGVLMVVTDNATGAGATGMFSDATQTDSAGNTWTRQQNTTYDPGANNAGTAIAVFTGVINTALTSAGNVTLNLAAAATPKVAIFVEVMPGAGNITEYFSSGVKCSACTSGQTGTAVQLSVTGGLTIGEVAICFLGGEGSGVPTGDSDTTNGVWSAPQGDSAGSGNTGQGIYAQAKIATGAGAQSWDVTLSVSEDWNAAWVRLREAAAPADVHSGRFFMLFP